MSMVHVVRAARDMPQVLSSMAKLPAALNVSPFAVPADVLVTVANCGLLALPTVVSANTRFETFTVSEPRAAPMPCNGMVRGFSPGDVPEIVISPLTVSADLAENTTMVVQMPLADSVELHPSCDSEKSPVVLSDRPATLPLPGFSMRNDSGTLLFSTGTLPKTSCAGHAARAGSASPVPVSVTTAGAVHLAVLAAVNVPVCDPAAMGANTTCIVQSLPAASVAPQLFWLRWNAPAAVRLNPPRPALPASENVTGLKTVAV